MKINFENIVSNLYNKSFLLAISGGIDSMVLLDLFIKYNLQKENISEKLKFSIVHCNFNLRGDESIKDFTFVKDFCNKNTVKFYFKSFETKNLKSKRESIQMTTRRLRYDFFKKIMTEESIDLLVTAHHLDDNLETFIINLTRGSGLKGLSGMKIVQNNILRPLIFTSKEEIINYSNKNNVKYREDSSNKKTDYLRNKIRHQIIPNLKSIESNFLSQFLKSQQIISDSNNFIKQYSKNYIEEILTNNLINLKTIKELDKIIQYEIFSFFGFKNENEISKILDAKTGSVFISKKFILNIDRDFIKITDSVKKDFQITEISKPEFEIYSPIYLKGEIIKDYDFKKDIVFDLDEIKFPVKIRTRRNSDFFYPINGKGKQKLNKYLKNKKIPNYEKDDIFIISDSDDRIVWIIGYRQDDRFKITDKTKKVIKISNKYI